MSSRVKEFKAMNEVQLKDKLSELRMELIKQNAQIATGTTPKSPGLIRETKRNIARIMMILESKQLKSKKRKTKKQEGEEKKV